MGLLAKNLFLYPGTQVNPKQMLECRPKVSSCPLLLVFPLLGGLVANDGGYFEADELLLAPRLQLLHVARGLAVLPWLLLRRHHNPRDVNIQPWEGGSRDSNIGARTELLPGLESRVR